MNKYEWLCHVAKCRQVNPAGLRIAVLFALQYSGGGKIFPAIETLRKETDMGKTSIIAGIKSLELSGFVTVSRKAGISNRYKIKIKDDQIELTGIENNTGMENSTGPEKKTGVVRKAAPDRSGKPDPNTITNPIPNPKKKHIDPLPKYEPLLNLLEAHLHGMNPDKKFKPNWRREQGKAIRLLIESDGAKYENVERVLKWLPNSPVNGTFSWGKNILSAAKLRIKYDKLMAEQPKGEPKREAGLGYKRYSRNPAR